ncbi:hypothetical protein E2320_021503 [Naja naja]|nr:hypothetical protein E2320_021503 [Naja naja]
MGGQNLQNLQNAGKKHHNPKSKFPRAAIPDSLGKRSEVVDKLPLLGSFCVFWVNLLNTQLFHILFLPVPLFCFLKRNILAI